MEDLRIISSGLSFLDKLLGGGFLSNSIVAISHQIGVRCWELFQRMVASHYDDKFHFILITFHLSPEEYLDRAKCSSYKSGFLREIERMGSNGSLTVIDCFNIPNNKRYSKIEDVHYVSNPSSVDELLSVMSRVRGSVSRNKRVYWIFSNLTNMSVSVPETNLLKFCRRAFRFHKMRGDLAFYLLNESAHTDNFFAKLYQLADVFIRLIAEEKPSRFEHGVQVIKSIFPFQSKKFFFDINEIGVFEKGKKPRATNKISFNKTDVITENNTREGNSKLIKTGIHVLDSLLGGGILSNSIIVASFGYSVRPLESIHHIFQNRFTDSTHVILVNYHFLLREYEIRTKVLEQRTDIHKAPLKSFSYGNASIIDCFNVPRIENDDRINDDRMKNVYRVSTPFDADRLLSVMTRVRDSVPKDKDVFWIFYSLTDMNIGLPEDEVLKFCRRAFRYHKWWGDLALYTINERAHTEMFRAKLYQLSDVFINFVSEETRGGMDTSIQILRSPFGYSSKRTRYFLDERGQIHSWRIRFSPWVSVS